MTTNVVKNDDATITVEVPVSGEEWTKAQKKALARLKRNMNIKGFRKGQVPDSYAKKLIGDEHILEEAAHELAQPTLNLLLDEEHYRLVDRPIFDVKSLTPEEAVLTFTLSLEPEAELGEYKNLGITKDEVVVTDEEIDQTINDQLARDASWELVEDETPAKKGDKASVSFYEIKEGEDDAKAAEAAEQLDIIIGGGRLYKDFEDQIAGMKTGEVKDIAIVFPENYPSAEMAGRPATFRTTLTELSTREVPELNDEAAAELEIPDVKTVDELKAYVKERLEQNKENQAENKYVNELLEKVADNITVDIPAAMIDEEAKSIFQDFASNIQRSGFSIQDYLEATNSTPEVIMETMRPDAEKRVRVSLAMDALAKAENLAATEEEIDQKLAEIAEQTNMSIEDLKKRIHMDQVADSITTEKVIDFLKSVQ